MESKAHVTTLEAFSLYLAEGFRHITDYKGYDHILFLAALCAPYELRDLRTIVGLVTAFTLGHSLTLALATLEVVVAPSEVIELLIAVTIVFSSLVNVYGVQNGLKRRLWLRFTMAAVFGLVHGLGFSNFLRSMLGRDIVGPLFAFNIGLEAGQLIIVLLLLITTFIMVDWLRLQKNYWVVFVSGATAGVGALLIIERL